MWIPEHRPWEIKADGMAITTCRVEMGCSAPDGQGDQLLQGDPHQPAPHRFIVRFQRKPGLCTLGIPALGRLRQVGGGFKAS